MSKTILYPTEEEFNGLISSETPVLVDFWAEWCAPCRMLAPVLEKLAAKYDGKALVAKIDIDKYSNLANEYDVTTIPTIIAFKNGEIKETIIGLRPVEDFEKIIDGLI